MAKAPTSPRRPKATHYGSIELMPGTPFECAVLEDGRRGFILYRMIENIGFSGGSRTARFGRFCAKIGLNSLAHNGKTDGPVLDVDLPHGGSAQWVPAEIMTDIIKAGAIAAWTGKLTAQQRHIGDRCIQLSSALIGVGLTAMIDEGTGYQYARAPNALQDLFSRLIRETAADWERRFHPEYYSAVCKLFGIKYGNRHRALPGIIGQITERFVYLAVFPKEIITEIKTRQRSEKLHQWLTDDGGLALLNRQVNDVTAIARSSVDYRDFEARCAQAFYKPGQQLGFIYPKKGA